MQPLYYIFNITGQEKKFKKTRCHFCDEDVISKNYVRHLERVHGTEKEVVEFLKLEKGSKERRLALSLFRNNTNFDLFLTGETRFKRLPLAKRSAENLNSTENLNSMENLNGMPCVYCKGVFRATDLKRHAKRCPSKQLKQNQTSPRSYLTESQTLVACAADPSETISLLNVKNKVSYSMCFW